MTNTVGFPLFSTPLVDPKTGVATKDFFFFLQQIWKIGTGGDQRTVSVDDLQVQDEVESATSDTAGALDSVAISALENIGTIGDELPVMFTTDEVLSHIGSEQDANPDADAQVLGYLGPEPELPARAQPVAAITPGASPYTYTSSFDGAVIVNGGTVSAIAFSRDGTTFFTTGQTAGMFPMSRGDALKVTYTVAPTMTFAPR